jgi:hypothetical protein
VSVRVYIHDPPEHARKDLMEFHLIYSGELLKSAGNTDRRVWEKHSIRRYMHSQLKNLWETHPSLKSHAARTVAIDENGDHLHPEEPFLSQLAKVHEKAGMGFIPIMTEANGLVCELDILLLRPEGPGSITNSAGDIDNRIKTLIDALRVPRDKGEMRRKVADDPDPNPMYCLMQDDKLISSLRVKTDRLLFPQGQSGHEAVVIIRVSPAQIDPFGSPWELHL